MLSRFRIPRGCRNLATLVSGQDYRCGQHLHGFTITRTKSVPELELRAIQLRHNRTGAEYIHLERDDDNNVFSIGFKTDPPDHTGVPHILEHTTLCGSQKFPVRDPFFKMLRRSLSNFMNAFTSADHTSYPFATTNRQDFQNLMNVYLDATLSPLLRENDFYQEGWRLAYEDSKPVFKGVVYNEMKGQMSDSSYLFYVKFQNAVFPQICNSGGDPSAITALTYAQLKQFHHDHYHPTNAKLLSYGNMPLLDHARLLDTYLQTFDYRPTDRLRVEPLMPSGKRRITAVGPMDPLLKATQQYKMSLTWVTPSTADVVETFALGVLSSLLLDGYGSSFYTALIATGLGTDFTPNTGFDSSARRGLFSIGLSGLGQGDLERAENAIHETLQETHQRGFDPVKVDGIMHQLELALKHKTANFGLGIIQKLQPSWFNDIDPFEALAWNDILSAFKTRLAEGRYLEDLLHTHLMNGRDTTFIMAPDSNFAQSLEDEESARIQTKIQEMNESSAGRIEQREAALREEQDLAPDQDLSSLPTVHVSDIPISQPEKTFRDVDFGQAKTQWHECSTNGLTYFRAIHELQNLPHDLRMLLPLFTDALMRLGTRDKSMEELEDLIKLNTGGLGISYHSKPSPHNPRKTVEGFSFSGYALDSKVQSMYDLLRRLIVETDFDDPGVEQKLVQLLQTETSGALDAVANSGHAFARRYAEAGLSLHGRRLEQVQGLTHLHYATRLAQAIPSVIDKLKQIQKLALQNTSHLRMAVNCGPDAVQANEAALAKFLSHFPDVSVQSNSQDEKHQSFPQRTHFQMPFQVSYIGHALPTVGYNDVSSASLQIASQLLTHKHLHHEIREKGGAYGGGAYARALSGVFGYYSYRDPSPDRSLEIFRRAGEWVRDKSWTSQDLEEAKLSVFQSLDAPRSVAEEGMTRFVSGIDHHMEQQHRERLLAVTKADVQTVAQKYLVEGASAARTTVLGPTRDWLKAGDWTLQQIDLAQVT